MIIGVLLKLGDPTRLWCWPRLADEDCASPAVLDLEDGARSGCRMLGSASCLVATGKRSSQWAFISADCGFLCLRNWQHREWSLYSCRSNSFFTNRVAAVRNHDLSQRDLDVIEQMVTHCKSTREAAAALGIAVKSVQAIKTRIVDKLGLDDWTQVADKFAK
jgi:DNA-binding CsgD family transcriptional regulator